MAEPGQSDTASSHSVQEAAEVVGTNDLFVKGNGPAFYTNMAYGNAVAHQQAMQQLQLAATGQIVKKLTEVDMLEALSVLKASSGNDVAQQLAQLMAVIAGNQQMGKGAGNTPPVTP